MYGLVDLGVVRESGGPAGSMTKLTSGIANGSRLGFKGIENLGGDLSAFFSAGKTAFRRIPGHWAKAVCCLAVRRSLV
ncbi:porin [Undibacterium arcticum]